MTTNVCKMRSFLTFDDLQRRFEYNIRLIYLRPVQSFLASYYVLQLKGLTEIVFILFTIYSNARTNDILKMKLITNKNISTVEIIKTELGIFIRRR